jgi:hypothetical protein
MLNRAGSDSDRLPRVRLVSPPINLLMTLTPADIRTVRRESVRLPTGWFLVRIITTTEPEEMYQHTYVILEQIAGPAIGTDFTIRRRKGCFVVSHRKCEQGHTEYWPAVETIEEAIQSVRNYVDDVLTTWGLRIA